MTPELIVARAAARAGGQVVAQHARQGVTMRTKDLVNLVSDADIEAERAIVRVIAESFPDHEILAEELHQGRKDARHLWVIDPLDGTHNFAHGVEQFAVSIAYYRDGVPECGVVYEPMRGDEYASARGQGAYHNEKRVAVSPDTRLEDVLIGFGFCYERGEPTDATLAVLRELVLAPVLGLRRFGSAALDLCMVGIGQFAGFFEYGLSPWDYAAGCLFVSEAGGKVSNGRGEPLGLERSSVLATNGPLYDKLLSIVRPHHPRSALIGP